MKYLVSTVYWLLFGLTAPVIFVLGLGVFAVSAPFDPDRRVLHAFICRATWLYLKWNPWWDVQVLHRERLPRGASVLVANHQSMADIVAAMGLFHPFKFVSKASLFQLPLVGWMMTLIRHVSVERGRRSSMQAMMATCRAWLSRGMPVFIFPEGTYSEDGRLLPFKPGAFQLAYDGRVPLVPIVIAGTRDLVLGDGPWMSPRCTIRVTVLPPLLPGKRGENPDALSAQVRQMLLEGLDASGLKAAEKGDA